MAKFDLTLYLRETPDHLGASFEYNNDLFDHASIERMACHYLTLLEKIAAKPGQRIAEISFLTEPERRLQLATWNDTRAAYPRNQCLHQLIEGQSGRSNETIAVTYERLSLTYGALNRRADQVARALRRMGVGPEVRVALCLERSHDMLIGLLAILKAGGAYVPLDPGYPEGRLAYVLEDASVAAMITQVSFRDRFPRIEVPLILVDAEPLDAERAPGGSPALAMSPDSPAYLIYTSGSTGRPKGVRVAHRAVVNFLETMGRQPGLTPDDRLLAVTTISFDIAALELFLPLTTGARVVIAGAQTVRDGALLLRALSCRGITVMQATPATWRLALASGWDRPLPIRAWSGGESLDRDLAVTLRARTQSLWNLYGPTEATIWTAAYRDEGQPQHELAATTPIGKPIANTQLYVLDADLRLLASGSIGDLLIGGVCLAQGYWGLPELTADRFVPNPYAGAAGDRLYRVGDRARFLPDGHLELLGRSDHQLKLHGFRIEPVEIEAALITCPGIEESVVIAREDLSGDRRLVAYLTGEIPGQPGDRPARLGKTEAGKLRALLKQRLPDYMIPSVFVLLDAIPLTPNGKRDRNALPAYETAPLPDRDASPPGSPMEELLASIWAELLQLERIDADDHFFELGGHSLLALKLVSQVRRQIRVDLPVRLVFEKPILRELAQAIESGLVDRQKPEIPLTRSIRREAVPLSFAQRSLWALHRLRGPSNAYNMPATFKISGSLDPGALIRCFQQIHARHEILRTTIGETDDEPVQVIQRNSLTVPLIHIPMEQFGPEEGEAELQRLVRIESARIFDLERGPLLRVVLFRLAPHEHLLSVTMHHIVSDGWSQGIMVHELVTLYRANLLGQPNPLPELPIQYPDFALWQRQWLTGEFLAQQLAYWKKQLHGARAVTLPYDHPRSGDRTRESAAHGFLLSEDLSKALRDLSRRGGATVFMVLAAAFHVLLHFFSRQDNIVLGTMVANRNRAELEGLIGLFVNQLLLRFDLSGNPTFLELMDRARTTALEAYAHQDIPFELLVKELGIKRDADSIPLNRVQLVYQNAGNPEEAPGGLDIRPVSPARKKSRYDLVLDMTETPRVIRGSLQYDMGLFEKATMTRMAEYFQALLQRVCEYPETELAELVAILTEREEAHRTEIRTTLHETNFQKLQRFRRSPVR